MLFGHLFSKYHQRRLQSRDKKIASVGERLKVQGYERGPFSSPSVRGFLKELGELRARAEQTARREKVRAHEAGV